MARSSSRLFAAPTPLSLEQQAVVSRNLISANELYKISNSVEYSHIERSEALKESSSITKEALDIMPSNPVALSLMARIEMDHARQDNAEILLERALEIAPEDENIRLNYGYLKIAKRQYSAAVEQFNVVLIENKQSVQAFSGIALAKLRRQDHLGAFQHYRRLLELGCDSPSIRNYFLESIEFLTADYYQQDLETLLLTAFSWENVDHQKLSNLVSSLLHYKYDLENEHAVIDLQLLVKDQLLHDALAKTLLPSIPIENLITAIRSSILEEVAATKSLSNELLPFAMSIGLYCSRIDYVLMQEHKEEEQIENLKMKLRQEINSTWDIDNIIGALIILSMYDNLYTQNFSFQLLKHDLCDWPKGTQSLLKANLYDLCDEHQMDLALFGNNPDRILNNEIHRANSRWNSLNALTKSDLYSALADELGTAIVPQRFKHDPIKILLLGCGSGLRAAYLSQYFENIQVCAIDRLNENIAYAQIMKKKLNLENVSFTKSDYESALIDEYEFDIIEFGNDLNHVQNPKNVIQTWASLLAEDGLIRFTFNTQKVQKNTGVVTKLIQERGLSATTDNIRHLRHAIIQEASSGLWDKLLTDEYFYTGTGCKELLFNKYSHCFDLKMLNDLFRSCGLSFAGHTDLSARAKDSNPMAPLNLLAWHAIDQDKNLFGIKYHLYCAKV